ncbi:MAG TPA: DUF86 domain-containing protein [Sulfuricurvum sp.]|jgi:uncharacterized protein with HEPN domain|nr:MAG: hypothetical protein B7Y30_09605 [Campylobacterales bacterium 16-40-21]OZA01920.1 MAG: hypothetical protein B7X89_11550 [Sulfuricurvum sp. 17-40-25]HQS67941.1 DUF86 domain-containing protein [Sulfuricurvum sp.]HQT37209.1 DUF86 domain-containing protein [Sulfuricurvum sp.]
MDKKNTKELLEYILQSIELIQKRFLAIRQSDDFMKDDEGLEKLDSISMRLQSIGEALKNIYKTDPQVLENIAPKNYWSEIIKFREVISHHYIDIDSEVVFEICHDELNDLETKIIVALASQAN